MAAWIAAASKLMLEQRRLYRDFFALALLARWRFLSLSLVSYDTADPVAMPVAPLDLVHAPDAIVDPPNERVQNICGYCGALAADALLTWFGVGAYYFVLSLAVLDFQLLRRREIDSPALRMFGWIASLLGITTAVAIALPALSPGPVIGSGGYLGALGKSIALTHFATAGGLIIAASVTLGGLLLCTDYALIETCLFLYRVALLPKRAVRRCKMLVNCRREENEVEPTSMSRCRAMFP